MDLSCNLILLLLLIFDGKEGRCGIPILTWLIGFFIILAFKTILKGFTIFFIEANPQIAQRYVILSTFSSDILLILWLIYGNMLFYSDKNDCDKREGTTFEFYLMFLLLLFGYFVMAMYALILLMVPIVLVMIYRERNMPREGGRIVPERSTQKVLDSLKVLKFSNLGSLE